MAKRLLSILLCMMLLMSTVAVVASAKTTEENNTSAANPYTVASQEIDDKYGYNGDDLGATYTPEKTTFKVWSPKATKVVLNLYATGSDQEEGAANLGNYELTKVNDENGEFTGVWSVEVLGDLKNVYYTYSITATDVTGKEFETVETQDVYSVATGVNSARSMVCDLSSTNPEGWENDKHVLQDKNTDSIVWEIHVKDFSYSEESGVSEANRGKYLAFTENGTTLNGEGNLSTCIDYLKELGVTTVQILPFYDYGSVDETGDDSLFNWGYDPMNYNVPEGSYSSNPYDGNVRIKECKQMIQALHNAGFSVVMDVVYNHTYSQDSCFQHTAPGYYYRMNADGTFSNGTGCGNETASERLMFRNYVMQSCLYWVNEFHVDGFRFDLMGCMDVETMNMIREELDKVDPRITMWGEGWTGGTCTYPETTCTGETLLPAILKNAESINSNIALFNDSMRDGLKGSALEKDEAAWVQGLKTTYDKVYAGIYGNSRVRTTWKANAPSQCVTYASCHDNTTLWDKLCDTNKLTDYYDKRNDLILAENKLTAGLLGLSQGVLFFNAGEEMGRTKLGDHNSYRSSPDVNKIDWSLIKTNSDLVAYYKGLFQIRKNFAPITDNTTDSHPGYLVYTGRTISDKLGMVINNDTEGQWKSLALMANNSSKELVYELPNENKEWVIIANDQLAGLSKLGEVKDGVFTIAPRSMVIAVDKASFEAVNLEANTGKLTVKYVDKLTGTVLDQMVTQGEIGSKYETSPSTAIPQEYKLASVEGDEIGEFTAEGTEVVYLYDYYVPTSMNNDVTGDGKTNINDATVIQKYLVGSYDLTEEQINAGDYNLDGNLDINDVTTLQKHLAGYSVGLGSVKVNYYKTGTEEEIALPVVYNGRVGDVFEIPQGSALGYVQNKELAPADNKVVVAYGEQKVVNCYYDYVGSDVSIHVKHSGDVEGMDWAPSLWLWGQKKGVDSGTNYCTNKSWPGDTLTMGEDGWYTTSFVADSNDSAYNLIVSNNAAQQSADIKGFTQLELWVVIDDANSSAATKLFVYDENPELNPDAEYIVYG